MNAEDRALATLRWFVFRARRIAEHSLAGDLRQLLTWAQGSMKGTVVHGGESTVTMDLPDEESFESLAGRCRPFMLPRDDLYFGNVLDALRIYVFDDAEMLASVESIDEHWSRLDPKSKTTLGYASRVGKLDELFGDLVPDTTLADAWLYCDFGHGDTDVSERVGQHDLDSRFHAAVLLVSNIAVVTVMTLNLIRECWQAGLLPLDDDDFSRGVLARTDFTAQLIGMASGPVGTPVEELEAVLERLPPESDVPR